jgi:mRNA-degrading endonuclease toxin of MazEF toxin-antitoxin module
VSPERLPQRGAVWRLAFEPSVAAKDHKNRATVIVSNDVASRELTSMDITSRLRLSIQGVPKSTSAPMAPLGRSKRTT